MTTSLSFENHRGLLSGGSLSSSCLVQVVEVERPPIEAMGRRELAGIFIEHRGIIQARGDFEVLRPEHRLRQRQGPLVERLRFGVASLHPGDPSEGAERLYSEHLNLGAACRLLHHRHGPLGQAFRFSVIAQLGVQACQGIQDIGQIGMVRADGVLHEGERLPAERHGLLKPPLGLSRDGKIVEADGVVKGVKSSPFSASLLGRLWR